MTTTTSTTHPDTCRCPVHADLQARRDDGYRRLALTILGAAAPSDTAKLAEALTTHARTLAPAKRRGPSHAA